MNTMYIINIFEIKFENKKICLKMAAKTSFVTLCDNALSYGI